MLDLIRPRRGRSRCYAPEERAVFDEHRNCRGRLRAAARASPEACLRYSDPSRSRQPPSRQRPTENQCWTRQVRAGGTPESVSLWHVDSATEADIAAIWRDKPMQSRLACIASRATVPRHTTRAQCHSPRGRTRSACVRRQGAGCARKITIPPGRCATGHYQDQV